MKQYKNKKFGYCTQYIRSDTKAVLGLPMRLTVSLIIGTIALIALIAYITNPCLFPKRMLVTITPLLFSMDYTQNLTSCNITVHVIDEEGYEINNAQIIISGLGGVGSALTDNQGNAVIQMQVTLAEGVYEGYLDVMVRAYCHQTSLTKNMIKVVRTQ